MKTLAFSFLRSVRNSRLRSSIPALLRALPACSFSTSCSSMPSPCSKSFSNAIPVTKTEKGTADFFVEQIFTGCIAEYSYYLDSEGEAIIIDPIYDHGLYLELAAQRGAKIKYVFETHFHADFVSGHFELAKKTGAQIVFGPLAKANFKFHLAKDHEIFKFGKAQIEVLHTPGHTLESSSFLLRDSTGQPHSVYTGDTLFIGEVGRPDLAANSLLKPEDMAKLLFDSIRNKLMPLPDHVLVFPGHGAGSPCGKSIGAGDYSTIGEQKTSNYSMIKDLKKEDFIKIASSNLPRPLGYMAYDVSVNKGAKTLQAVDEIIKDKKKSFQDMQKMLKEDKKLVVLDTREDISKGLLKNTINIGLNTTFSIYAGTMISNDTPIFLIAENQKKTEESIIRLLRVGYDNIVGYLDGGVQVWLENNGGLYEMATITADNFKEIYEKGVEGVILDIRNKAEWEEGVLKGAKLVPMRDLEEELLKGNLESLKKGKVFMHCRTGPRAITAYSLFSKFGFNNIVNILGGYNRMKELGYKFVQPVL